jgi:hypothetical protein
MLPLRPLAPGTPRRAVLEQELTDLHDWYARLADAVAGTGAAPETRLTSWAEETAAGEQLLKGAGEDDEPLRTTLAIAWTRQHLLMLARLEQPLAQAASALVARR